MTQQAQRLELLLIRGWRHAIVTAVLLLICLTIQIPVMCKSSNSSNHAAIDNLKQWMQTEHGVSLNSDIYFEYEPTMGYSIYTSKELVPDTVVVSIPFVKPNSTSCSSSTSTSILHSRIMLREMKEFLYQYKVPRSVRTQVLSLFDKSIARQTLITVFLSIEKLWKPLLIGSKQKYRVYMNTLPRVEQMKSFPFMYSRVERDAIEGTTLQPVLSEFENYQFELYFNQVAPILNEKLRVALRHNPQRSESKGLFTTASTIRQLPVIGYRDYLWGLLIQYSRSFSSELVYPNDGNVTLLLPILDIFNSPSDASQQGNIFNRLVLDDETGTINQSYQMVTRTTVPKGQQLLFHYHNNFNMTNALWLLTYGFCLNNNENNEGENTTMVKDSPAGTAGSSSSGSRSGNTSYDAVTRYNLYCISKLPRQGYSRSRPTINSKP